MVGRCTSLQHNGRKPDTAGRGIASTTYYRVPRYYTFGQYTKYIEPDAVRVDVEAVSSEADKLPEELLVSVI